MATLDSIVAQLRTAVDHLHQAVRQTRVARDGAEELRNRMDALGARGLVQRLDGIVHAAQRLEALLLAGIDAGEQLIAQVEAIRTGGSAAAGGGGGVAVPTGGGSGSVPEPAVPTADPAPPSMPRLANQTLGEIVDRLPPRPGRSGPTHGQVFDEAGNSLGGQIRSYRMAGLHDDLNLSEKARAAEPMNSHVEAKVAKMMRDGDLPQHVTIVINNRKGPCGWQQRREGIPLHGLSCEELLSDVIPAGSSITVRWRDADGWGRRQIYNGTGRRIRS